MAEVYATESKRGVLGKLPLEIIERALSFLSVPELCRMRSVCKSWNEIISRPSFHDLCDVNGRNDEYLFMWSEAHRWEPRRVVVNPIFSVTLSFLDVNARRWYSIPAADLPRVCGCEHEVECRFMAMNHGLVCELTTVKDCGDNSKFALAISDPVAKTRRMLSTPPQVFVAPDIQLVSALIVTAVDVASRSYKVFLLNNLSHTPRLRAQPRMYVHESFSDEWRALRVPNGVQDEQGEEDWAEHAVVVQGSLFVLKQHNDGSFNYRLSLFRYRIQEDTWAEAYQMFFPRILEFSAQLIVSRNRLFLNVWLGGPRSSDPSYNRHFADPGLRSDPDCPDPGRFFLYPNFPETDSYFEMHEVLFARRRRKPVVQFTLAQLQHIFGIEHGSERYESELMDVTHAFPFVDSNGLCNSVVLVKAEENRYQLKRFDLVTGSVEVLPPHPMVQPSENLSIGEYLNVENMKLSLRNLLAQRPKEQTSTGLEILEGGCQYHK